MMLFDVEHLTYRYEGVTAVDDLSLAIPEGRVALLGANGSGKSTLLRLLDDFPMKRLDWAALAGFAALVAAGVWAGR